VLPAADADGWRALPSKGARGLELTLEGRSRVRVRSLREGDGRFRILPLTEGAPAGQDKAGTPPADPKAAEAIPIAFERAGGLLYLGLGGPAGAPDPPVAVELDLPARMAATLMLGASELTLTGEPVAIPEDLEPYVPPPPRQMPAPPGSARPASSSA